MSSILGITACSILCYNIGGLPSVHQDPFVNMAVCMICPQNIAFLAQKTMFPKFDMLDAKVCPGQLPLLRETMLDMNIPRCLCPCTVCPFPAHPKSTLVQSIRIRYKE